MLLELVVDERQHRWLNLISQDVISLSNVVVLVEEEVAIGPSLSPACSPDLLHVVFYALGHVEMDHALEVREIETHAEGDSRHHYLEGAFSELLQGLGLLLVGQGRVVDGSWRRDGVRDVVEHFCHDLSGPRVDQDSLAFFDQSVVEVSYEGLVLEHSLFSRYGDEEVLVHAVGRTHHLLDLQLLLDGSHSFWVGCGCKSEDGGLVVLVLDHVEHDVSEGQEGSPEVVAEFRERVGLVDACEVGLRKVLEVVDEVGLEALWRQEEEVDLALLDHRDDFFLVLAVDERTDARCRQVLRKVRQLIQHQRHQRTDDDR